MSNRQAAEPKKQQPKRPRGRPRVAEHERREKKYVGLAPADLEKFEALQALDRNWLTNAVRAAKLPKKSED